MNFNEFKASLLKDEGTKKAYEDKTDIAFEIGRNVFKARMRKGITQKELAKKISTQQPSIARLEAGGYSPSILFLEKIAKALDTYVIAPTFNSIVKNNTVTDDTITI